MRMIDIRIKYYQSLINHLEDNKPLFFQKKKLTEYNNKLKEYNSKISDLYNELGEKCEMIEKLYSASVK